MRISSKPAQPLPAPADHSKLREAAQELEAAFLAEMLKPMGAAAERQSFGGGAGEAQFGSFLVAEEAREMARAGGIGLAAAIFESMLRSSGAPHAD